MPESKIYPTRLKIELEAAASMDLQDLTHELSMISEDHLPSFKKAINTEQISQGLWISSLMAIAFEAGRRCGVHQAIETAII